MFTLIGCEFFLYLRTMEVPAVLCMRRALLLLICDMGMGEGVERKDEKAKG